MISLDVEVSKEPNPRQADHADRVEITLHSRGPVVRAEAAAADPYAALDLAADQAGGTAAQGTRQAVFPARDAPALRCRGRPTRPDAATLNGEGEQTAEDGQEAVPTNRIGTLEVQGEGPLVVREKTHAASPMALDQALDEMELVGHDFYLFVDADTKQPSVVYRRHAYDYGVIHLNADESGVEAPAGAGGALRR